MARELGGVGTKVVFENDQVRVWVLKLAPGERSAVHRHDLDHLLIQIRGDRIAVVSQSSSALWIGTLATTGFAVEDSGTIYEFPRDADRRVVYGTVEGVSWLTDDRLVMVSDRAKGDTPARAKEQSLHVFRLPSSA